MSDDDHDVELKLTMPEDKRSQAEGYGLLNGFATRVERCLSEGLAQDFPDAKVSRDEFDADDEEFSVTVYAQRGLRVGTEVDIDWEPGEAEATVDVSTFAKLQTILGVGLVVGFMLLGVVLTIADVPPFDALPGRKFGALIGGLGMAIPGLVLFLIINPIVMSGTGPDNEALLKKVGALVTAEHEAFVADLQGAASSE